MTWITNPFRQPDYDYYVGIDGAAGNYVSAPDTPASPRSDLFIRVRARHSNWLQAAIRTFIAHRAGGLTQWHFRFNSGGFLRFIWSIDGVSNNLGQASSVPVSAVNGAPKWFAVSYIANTGAGSYEVKYFEGDDGATWSQVGAARTGVSTADMFDSTADLTVGGINNGTVELFGGDIFFGEVRSGGAAGPVKIRFHPKAPGANPWVSATGETWTPRGNVTVSHL